MKPKNDASNEKTLNLALFLDGEIYNGDAIFDETSVLNHDKLLHVWLNMKQYLNDHGVNVHTYDQYSDLRSVDKAVFFGLYGPNPDLYKKCRELDIPCYFVAYEPPVIHSTNTRHELMKLTGMFRRILTHQDDLIDNRRFFRISEGKAYPDMSGWKPIPFEQKRYMMMMNSYRYANNDSYRELYSERFRASKFFEQASDEFHVYGRGLNDPARVVQRWPHKKPVFFHSYVGEVENKMAVLAHYKFNLCFENCIGVYGYISEKILHCFRGETVPVYWGPVNPTDYFPAETFVDVRAFEDYADLHRYLNGMTKARYNDYLDAMRAYLESEQYERFFGKWNFGRAMLTLIEAEDRLSNTDVLTAKQGNNHD